MSREVSRCRDTVSSWPGSSSPTDTSCWTVWPPTTASRPCWSWLSPWCQSWSLGPKPLLCWGPRHNWWNWPNYVNYYNTNANRSLIVYLFQSRSCQFLFEKYNHANKWKISCVTSAWILDSINRGYCLPTDQYRMDKTKTKTLTPRLLYLGGSFKPSYIHS